ncbi:uncharacterized protein LOC142982337 isoform X2 [Anticarsia gemmatalis]|uniref:uncharacterized protein LOC142982337 isoform X2 n=1 Tax=Anticarsia gemmatalis TaxID=129554 RepID=UPI003F770175
MLVEAVPTVMGYGAVIFSLFLVDYVLGHGFVDMSQKVFCRLACYVKRVVREESKHVQIVPDAPISWPVLVGEIAILLLTVAILNRYKYVRGKDRIDELLNESKDALRQTNEFLEKWRLRRVPTEYSYLDEEPQEIKPLKIEVPILHMAIIDTLGTTRSKPERGDAGDTVNITDSTLLSLTSFEDLESIDTADERVPDEAKSVEFRNRYLWDVLEEDGNNLDD